MVMIRPRGGDFAYSPEEISIMHQQIEFASTAGANGVVLGVLSGHSKLIAIPQLKSLLQTAHNCGLTVTFHRAFDATPDPFQSLETLINFRVDRVLTSGIPWGLKQTALDGIRILGELIEKSRSEIEIVIGGGITPAAVTQLHELLPLDRGRVSLHAYSGALVGGNTTAEAVRALVNAARGY
jgi:copper homeostasis protein